jgi:hypothetical protein
LALPTRSGSPNWDGFFMLRIAPIGRSSPINQRFAGASRPLRVLDWSINSPNTSESDSFIAPDW